MGNLRHIFLCCYLFFLIGCSVQNQEKVQSIVQISTIDALLQGVYDGQTTLGEINRFEMILPDDSDFLDSEFETDRSKELGKVES